MINTKGIEKPFKKADIIVYAVLIVVTILLFLSTNLFLKNKKNGFEVLVSGETILTLDFETNELKQYVSDKAKIEKLSENSYKIVSENGFNVIEIDFDNHDVSVIDTDCGISKECEKMSLSHGVIICAPHKLTIRPFGSLDSPKIG